MAQLVTNLPTVWKTWVRSLSGEDPLEKRKVHTAVSGLENSTDCIVHGVAKSRTQLNELKKN